MSKSFRKDLTGMRFGRLTVLEFVPTEGSYSYWLCKCDCGNTKTIESYNLRSGHTTSCGCFHRSMFLKSVQTHKSTKTRLYKIYIGMKTRCYNKNSKSFHRYGGRGIKICDEWLKNFSVFSDWSLANGYSDDLSIDRIDTDGNYEPSNCRWVDTKTQSNNRSITIFVEFNGKEVSLSEASKLSGIPHTILDCRYRRGDRGERLFRPVKK